MKNQSIGIVIIKLAYDWMSQGIASTEENLLLMRTIASSLTWCCSTRVTPRSVIPLVMLLLQFPKRNPKEGDLTCKYPGSATWSGYHPCKAAVRCSRRCGEGVDLTRTLLFIRYRVALWKAVTTKATRSKKLTSQRCSTRPT